jgi:hypothetical protein
MVWTPTELTADLVLDNGIEWSLDPHGIFTYNIGLNQESPVDSGSWKVATTVPEPSSAQLLLFTLTGALLFAARRRTNYVVDS